MKPPSLELEAPSAGNHPARTLALLPGQVAHWAVNGIQNSAVVLDELTGLREERSFLANVRWFGGELPRQESPAHYKLLRRIFPIVAGAPLLANINLAENILLPAMTRQIGKSARVGGELLDLVERHGEQLGLPPSDLTKLPHMVLEEQRLAAAILQARLARPEVIIICDAEAPWKEAWPLISRQCCWLRKELPDTSWLFLNAESGLPAEFSSDTITGSP